MMSRPTVRWWRWSGAPNTADRVVAVGRLRHFTSVTSPLTLLASSSELAAAQKLLQDYQNGVGDGRAAWGREDEAGIWKAKQRASQWRSRRSGADASQDYSR